MLPPQADKRVLTKQKTSAKALETTTGSNDGNDRPEPDPRDNVLHFPRDWFGPPEELVPIGSRASEARESTDSASPAPIAAEGFWGGEVIHEPLAAPDIGGPGAPLGASRLPRLGMPRLPQARRIAIPLVIAAGVLVCTLVAFQAFATRARLSTPPVSAIASRELPLVRALTADATAVFAGHERSTADRVPRATRRVPRHHVVAIPLSSSSSVVASSTETASGDTGASSQAAETSVGDGTAAAVTEPTSNSAGTSSGANRSSSSAAAPGPQGAGAPFGPGHLG
jgi:hypothetical protein